MDSLSSSSSAGSTKMKNNTLSVKNQSRFKKSFLLLRQKTILKKALELSILCENEICVIHYDRERNLVETYPEDQCQVKDILERYNRLSDREKLKKNTNLSQFYNKKLVDEKKRSLTNAEEHKKFTKKVGELEGSLIDQFHILQDRLRDLHQTTTEPDRSPYLDVMSEKNLNFFPTSFIPYDLDQQQESGSLMNLLTSGDHHVSATSTDQYHLIPPSSATVCSLNQQSKFSVFVFNHETATFTQLPNSVTSSLNHGLIGSY